VTEEKYMLSYGGGVNSTAILALIKQGKLSYPNLKIVFADTGCEKPSTYCYLRGMQKQFNIEVVKSHLGNLYDFCKEHTTIPMRQFRWCTDKFKLRPQALWRELHGYDDCKMILGFCFGEEKRAVSSRDNEYPLISLKINRDGCKQIIRDVGWEVPDKSGCYICSFQKKMDWIAMQKNQPDLWQSAVDLEKNAKITFNKKALEDWLKDEREQGRILDFEEYQHCLCAYD